MFIIVDEIYLTEKLFHKLILPKQITEIVFCNNSKCKKAPHFSVVLNCINNVKSPFFASSSCCVGIACAEGLYLGIIKSGFVHISAGSFGCLACHDLRNELLLIFEDLEQIAVKGFVGNITININFEIFIALTFDSTISLLHIRRAQRTVQMMQRNHFFSVHSFPHRTSV